MSVRIFSGDRKLNAIPTDDRGLAYGDGLFETMRAYQGEVPWWDAHWSRLQLGAHRARLPLPDRKQVMAEAAQLCAGRDGVLKLIVTRGGGSRGYAPPTDVAPTWLLSWHPLPRPHRPGGLVLRWCETRVALQPALAGIKHCNRLEQVLARAEWNDPGIDEGLLRSTDGDVVGATAANVFLFDGDRWRTPLVDRCGIAGVGRGWILATTDAREERLMPEDVEAAEALVLCNAVRGILPVARLGDRSWPPHPAVQALRERLGHAHPAFVPEEDA
jgi:4-amino-4-deoxychorismate lyase